MITIYEANETDFTTLGLGALTPIEATVDERAGGLYELTLVQPMTDDLREALIAQQRIIKAPAPVRETPLAEMDKSGSVTRHIYKVNVGKLNLRTRSSMSGKIIHTYRRGEEVEVTGSNGNWSSVIVLNGGVSGWMWTAYLAFVRDETETVGGDMSDIILPVQTRDQLFRIAKIERDSEKRQVTVWANHISYDLMGAIVASEYEPEDVPANQVCAQIRQKADHWPDGFEIHCGITDKISGDYTGRNIIDCLLDPDTGVAAQVHARVVRDNDDIFLLPDQDRDRGVELRYGKNLRRAVLTHDTGDLVTRIQPVGKTKSGEALYITENGGFVDSAHISDYPVIRTKRIEYDVVESRDLPIAQARAKLKELAEADFETGIDLAGAHLDADFVRLELTDDYRELANTYALHLYDTVPVIDAGADIRARVRMTGYTFDQLLNRYTDTMLGDIEELETTVYGYEIGNGSVDGTKIAMNSVNGDRLRDLSVAYAKIGTAAIEQLSANSIIAVRADIRELVAGHITTDQLYADLAAIAVAEITTANIKNANIDWAQINTLVAQIATLARAEIGTADISYAKIKDLATQTAIITEGVGGQLFINRLAVTDANMVSLTVGELMLRQDDGTFVRIYSDGEGGVATEEVEVEGDNIASATIPGGKLIQNTITARELNVASIFADTALVRAIKAANIDVADLYASNAFISALDAHIVSANVIQALEQNLDVWAQGKIDLSVGGLRVGGVNYILGTGTPYTAPSDGTRKQLFPWACVDTETANGLFGKTVTLSFDYDKSITSGTLTIRVGDGIAWPDVVNIGAGTATNQRIEATFALNAAGSTDNPTLLYIDSTWNGTVTFRNLKLEIGNKATDWSPNPQEFRAGAVEIDKDGIDMSGGVLNLRAGSQLSAKSGGVVQIEAGESSGSYLNLDADAETPATEGGVNAKTGAFSASLSVRGIEVLTRNYLSQKVVVGVDEPQDVHNVLWIKPQSDVNAHYTGYTGGSRDSRNGFGYNRVLTFALNPAGTTKLEASSTYVYELPVQLYYTKSGGISGVSLTLTLKKGTASITRTINNISVPHNGDGQVVTFNIESMEKFAADLNAISCELSVPSKIASLFVNSNQTLDLSITDKYGASSTSPCSVYYIP